jgi:hypothetical protein
MRGPVNRQYFSLPEPTAEKMSAFKREEVTGELKSNIMKISQFVACPSSNIFRVKKPGMVRPVWSAHGINKKHI